jgi:two-component system, sensor histidine kinase LadS
VPDLQRILGCATDMRVTTSSAAAGGAYAPHPSRRRLFWRTIGVTGGILLTFVLDRETGSAPVQHLYYLPIIFASIGFGVGGGLVSAAVAILLYHVANPQLLEFDYDHWDFLQMALFVVVGLITAKLVHDARLLRRLAMTDDLTGLHNLRSFEDRLASMVRAARDERSQLALLVLDVDQLKSLNDEYGHLAGADAVRTVGHIIAAQVPPEVVACRYGGDEFVVAVPSCPSSRAKDVADAIRRAVNAASPVLAGIHFPSGRLSISIGVACRSFGRDADGSNQDLGEVLFRDADAALYLAKQRGRNRIAFWYSASQASANSCS